MPRKWYGIFVGAGLLLAMFSTWQDEHQKVLALEADKTLATVTHFEEKIEFIAVAPSGPKGKDCLLTVMMRIANTGAPSVAEDFRIQIFKAGKEYGIVFLPFPPTTQTLYQGGSRPNGVRLSSSDYLPRKGLFQPIPTGGATSGYLQGVVQGLSQSEAESADTLVRISCSDIRGGTYKVEQTISHGQRGIPNIDEIFRQSKTLPRR